MAAPTIQEVREAIASVITEATGLQVKSTTGGPWLPPIGILALPEIPEVLTMQRGFEQHDYRLLVIEAGTELHSAEIRLGQFMGSVAPLSIKEAIRATPTLGLASTVCQARVVSRRPMGAEELGDDIQGPAAEFMIRVLVRGA